MVTVKDSTMKTESVDDVMKTLEELDFSRVSHVRVSPVELAIWLILDQTDESMIRKDLTFKFMDDFKRAERLINAEVNLKGGYNE